MDSTTKLGLRKSTFPADDNDFFNFDVDLDDNWDKIDANCINKYGSVDLTAEQKGTNATSPTGLTTKQQVEAMISEINCSVEDIASCTTASATTEKIVNLSGFSLVFGSTVLVTFTNANTATAPTLNVNSTGAKPIASEDGIVCSATNPAYFPAGSKVEFVYNGTNWVFKKRVVTNYVNGDSWYRLWSDGWIEQGGYSTGVANRNVTFLKPFSNTNYSLSMAQVAGLGVAGYWSGSATILKVSASVITIGTQDSDRPISWTACGY